MLPVILALLAILLCFTIKKEPFVNSTRRQNICCDPESDFQPVFIDGERFDSVRY